MRILGQIPDHRINSVNLLVETTLGEYNELAEMILKANEFQRRRIKSSSTVYSLLKSDLRHGIVIPPIVLALSIELDLDLNKKISENDFGKFLEQHKDRLVILDGLQRTYTIRDLLKELAEKNDPDYDTIRAYPLRIEIYLGINKIGVLYRMLTLNTGQTPMSSRHQIEIIYSDYIKEGIDGIKLIKQIEGESPNQVGEYNFKDIIDGFTSYLEKDYLTIERTDILDNIKSLEKLATEQAHKDVFIQFVATFDAFVKNVNEVAKHWFYDPEKLGKKLGGPVFAKVTFKIFNKSQVMTGFGSAISKLISIDALRDLEEARSLIDKIQYKDVYDDLNHLILKLDEIRLKSKKIGNDQRLFFHYLFRELFDKKSDSYLNFSESINEAFKQYERKTQ